MYIGQNLRQTNPLEPEGKLIKIEGDWFFKISNVDNMPPFFMSIVSDANHWMFIGSNGGLSAGRKDCNQALFPYYTVDKILETSETTGSKTILRVDQDGKSLLWEPFSVRTDSVYNTETNLYKSEYGNVVIFEQINHDLGTFVQISMEFEQSIWVCPPCNIEQSHQNQKGCSCFGWNPKSGSLMELKPICKTAKAILLMLTRKVSWRKNTPWESMP